MLESTEKKSQHIKPNLKAMKLNIKNMNLGRSIIKRAETLDDVKTENRIEVTKN